MQSGKKGYPPRVENMVHLKMAPKGRGDSELGHPSSWSFFMLNLGRVCSSPISEGRWDCYHYRLPSGWQKPITLQVPKLRNAASETTPSTKSLKGFSNEGPNSLPGSRWINEKVQNNLNPTEFTLKEHQLQLGIYQFRVGISIPE